MSNRIVEENLLTEGVAARSYWDVPHSTAIEGFATDISVNAGGTVDFKINVNGGSGTDYKIEIFRLGYYDGFGAREVAEITNSNAVDQALPLYDDSRGLVDAGNWLVTDSWAIPSDAVSGVYLARVQRLDANGTPIPGEANQIPFIVRNDGASADIVLQTSDTTWHAYNGWHGGLGNGNPGGPNFYGDNSGLVDHDPVPNSGGFAQDRAYAVSYNRPFITRDGTSPASGGQDYLFGADYAAIHWLEQNGYDVTYISGVDTDRLGTSWFENAAGENIRKAYISVGHDEYWSGDQRINVEDARDSGVNLMFWAGNEVYWKTRWDISISADGTEYRTLVCYKETWANGDTNAGPADYNNIDPSNVWTGTWRDTRFVDAVDAEGNLIAGGRFYVEGGGASAVEPISGLRSTCNCAENSLTGTLFGPDGNGQRASIDIPDGYGTLRVWRNTTIREVGNDLQIADGILGYEWNTVPDDDSRPAGLIKLSETTRTWNNIVVDEGNSSPPGVATHSLSLYRAESGALVFGAGTVFWSWGLSDEHDSSPYGGNIETTAFKQFTVNMFADMGIQPGVSNDILALQQLQRAFASTDGTPAVAQIDDLPDTVAALALVQITGTSSDTGGQVALVEVSLDGGATWRQAQTSDGWATWSYAWRPTAEGEYTVQARAIDDSLNVWNAAPDSETVTVTAPVQPTTFSLFDPLAPVSVKQANDGQPIELGMKFTVGANGEITELKYYRGAGDAGDTDTRDGHLWRVSDGALLGTVTFTSTSGQSGWQVAAFSAPVAVTAGVEYIVSYRTQDNYVAANDFFSPANEVAFDGRDDNAFGDYFDVIRAPQDATGNGNGVYEYGEPPVAPNDTFKSTNYFVDVTFDPADGPNDTPVITTNGGEDTAAISIPENTTAVTDVDATDANALVYSLAGGADQSKFTINTATGILSFLTGPNFEAPTDAGGDNVYDVIVRASDGSLSDTQAIAVTVTDAVEAPSTGSSIFEGEVPTNAVSSAVDLTDYELGTKFTVSESGTITKLQYYRVAGDSGDAETRTLNLWNAATGQNLGSVSVASDVGATGWQVGTLSAPIAVQPGTVYIVSYGYDQDGANDAYAANGNFFATTPNSSPDGKVTALVSGQQSGEGTGGIGNGLFIDGVVGALPTKSFNSTNYWVDVVFEGERGNTPPTFTSDASYTVAENQVLVGTVTATDAEGNPLGFAIVPGGDGALFQIDAATGRIEFRNPPDFETDASFDLTVSVSDGTETVQQVLTVSLTDVNEFAVTAPADGDLAANTVAENAAIGTIVGITAQARDADATTNAVSYSLTNDAGGRFAIDGTTGVVTVAGALDREAIDGAARTIEVTATSADGSSRAESFSVAIGDVDEFDVTAPVDADATTNSVLENAAIGTVVGITAQATDADATTNAVSYSLTANPGGKFAIDATTGVVTVAGVLDYDLATSHTIAVQAASEDGSTQEANYVIAVTPVASPGPVTVTLTAGPDIYTAPTSDDYIVSGLAGNDTITTQAGRDTITGGTGNDTISSGDGDDRILYGAGNNGSDAVDGGLGTDDRIVVTANAVTIGLSSLTGIERIDAAAFAGARILGSSGFNTFDFAAVALVGVTQIDTGAGSDSVTGSVAGDRIIGGWGHDSLSGLAGNDSLLGGEGNDTLVGGDGDDLLDGGSGIDRVIFSLGTAVTVDLSLVGPQDSGQGLDTFLNIENVTSGDANDQLTGSVLSNSLSAGLGDDILDGAAGNDSLYGGDGNDTLTGGAGSDRMEGGAGTDTALFTGTLAVTVSLATNGTQITGYGSDALVGIENVITGDAGDRLIGSTAANILSSGLGDDTLDGGSGNDSLYGSDGDDALTGGSGNDLIDGGIGIDTAVFTGSTAAVVDLSLVDAQNTGHGTDTLLGIENIVSGTGRDRLTGDNSANRLSASGGNDTLSGGAGLDILMGGSGNDNLTGGADADQFVFDTTPNASSNVDGITDFASGIDRLMFDDAVFAALVSQSGNPNDVLAAGQFHLGAAAADADDRLVYTQSTGRLHYDADGAGGSSQILIATLGANTILTTSDVFVF